MSGLVIRDMALEDLPAVCAVDRLCMSPPWAEETFAAEMKSTVARYRVAELDGQVVGYLGSHLILDEAHVTTFGVHPDVRRRAIGERLLADFLEAAVKSGARRVTLEARAGNEAALRLYRKYGFAPVSRRPRYYSDGEDAIVMWVEDTGRAGFQALLAERVAALRAGGEWVSG